MKFSYASLTNFIRLNRDKFKLIINEQWLAAWIIKKSLNEEWNERYYQIKKFVNEQRRYPNKYNIKEEKTLGCWCVSQRVLKRKSILSQHRIVMLEKLPGWYWRGRKTWEDNYKLFMNYMNKLQRRPVTRSRDHSEVRILSWFLNQRYRDITAEQKRLIMKATSKYNKLPGKFDERWYQNYRELQLWTHCLHTIPTMTNNSSLSRWCTTQRLAKKGLAQYRIISKEQIKLLEKITGWYWSKK